MYTCTVDLSEFRREVAKTKNEIAKACYSAARHAAEEGRDEAKRVGAFEDHTGKLRSEIRAEHGQLEPTGGSWDIVAPTPYALFVEGGTRPHPIVARRAANLHFWWAREGRWFHGRKVNHPGTRPLPFMGPAHIKAEAALVARLETELGRIAAGWS